MMCTVRTIAHVVLGFTIVPAILTSAGCASQPPSETQTNINTFSLALRQIDLARNDVIRTLDALNRYSDNPGRSRFDAFARSAQAVQEHGTNLENISAVMSDQGNAFFLNWENEISTMTNEQLKAHATSQRESAFKAFHEIDVQGPELRAAYDKFVADLRNLHTFFDFDKSASGVAAASTVISQARLHGADLKRLLDIQAANLTNVRTIFVTMNRH
jgi:hypothetical protein